VLEILTEVGDFLLNRAREAFHGGNDSSKVRGTFRRTARPAEQQIGWALKRTGNPRQKTGGRVSDSPLNVRNGSRSCSRGASQVPLAEVQRHPLCSDRLAN